ncbi:helix-turn-helix domain-containing protein [Roseibium aggregatum]|uniref:helix-turn-helix domain-containing protein n=1 Tax=Roseibium aggregatum TaxID=187304 RepID=UPI001E391DFF|nr:helix-turn-helix transcriptional regulator [Roseibium aggregatum]UES51601.1 helix-turn-helix domain-containing protein [Roseibium aggregatum]
MMLAAGSIDGAFLFENRTDIAAINHTRQSDFGKNCSNIAEDDHVLFVRKMHMTQKNAQEALAKWLYDAIEERRNSGSKAGKKISQSEVARNVGLDPSMLNKAANGSRKISAIELLKIAECLDLEIPSLAELEGRQRDKTHKTPLPSPDFSSQMNPDELTKDQVRISQVLTQVEEINQQEFNGEIPFKTYLTLVAAGLRKIEKQDN